MAVIPHPPYSPDLAPCDFVLFPKMKLKLKGRGFDDIEEIKAESQRVIDTLLEKDVQEAFQKWKRRWGRCLHAGGKYFEGDSGRQALCWILRFLQRQSRKLWIHLRNSLLPDFSYWRPLINTGYPPESGNCS
jgi:hypothetical protein